MYVWNFWRLSFFASLGSGVCLVISGGLRELLHRLLNELEMCLFEPINSLGPGDKSTTIVGVIELRPHWREQEREGVQMVYKFKNSREEDNDIYSL